MPAEAAAGEGASSSDAALTEVVVVAPTAQRGAGVSLDLVPSAASVVNGEALSGSGPASVLGGLNDRLAGVVLDEAQGDDLQPNLLYRGFEASPLAGDGQGLAVYLGGVRFNQPFGDTVNWDLIPDLAVDRMELMGSNPAFGLNALGGSLSIRLKDGFGYSGAAAELGGGSHGKVQGGFEFGRTVGSTALYVAGQGLNDAGWRQHSPSRAGQVYADLGWKRGGSELHLNLMAAHTDLTGNGVSPVELLAVDRTAVFTYPDTTRNRFERVAATGSTALGGGWSLQGTAYYDHFHQITLNGDAADAAPCPGDATVLCDSSGAALTGPGGAPVSNFVTASPYAAQFPAYAAGGPYSVLNTTVTVTDGYGAALQAERAAPVFGRLNHLLVGAGYDGASTSFSASTRLGALTLARGFAGPGVLLDLADGSVAPVGVTSASDSYGVYVSDTLEATRRLSLTLSGRYGAARTALHDQLGTSLNGAHLFQRFNPAAGATLRLGRGMTAYAGYAEASRAPTPAELSCASPQAPCTLTNFFVADPALKQVVARTVEAGLRGHRAYGDVKLDWSAGVYRTDLADDIQFVASPVLGRDYFTNIGRTRRQGVEAGLSVATGPWSLFASYAYVDATYRTALTLDGGQNPAADAQGLIHVRPGDHITSIPDHSLKFGGEYRSASGWSLGVNGRYAGRQYLSGDPANQAPPTKPYWLLNLEGRYPITRRIALRGWLQNLADARYASFGAFSPTSSVPILQAPTASNPRSLSPGQPIAGFAGLRISF
ncbi:TonB-dependent receptor [Phenylobacterium montanum]|uniref:TonB-dependent receptor n=1 Tax=Phenylobacterium montanum TaxID=2823693 RepID=A0A975G325_9CAUL|nr:TonB-dependent receptor [Caulobacter sp. S6]QUD89634.1 TonB-dependent receptor [Caulobacter sp. S6]